jgi:hypothetical protein
MRMKRLAGGCGLERLFGLAGLWILSGLPAYGQAVPGHTHETSQESEDVIRIREVASVHAEPDTAYLLMKVESASVSLAQAIEDNEKQISQFLAGLEGIGFDPSKIGMKNFVVMPQYTGGGVSLSRNLIIELEGIDQRPPQQLEEKFAELQDLGARYGSHCVTCIGSG